MTDDESEMTAAERVAKEIQSLGLEHHVAELDRQGYTVIPPEVSPKGLTDRLLAAVVAVAEKRNGHAPDMASGSTHVNYRNRLERKYKTPGDSVVGQSLRSMLFEGRVFEEALMNPVLLAIATYLCGYRCVLSSMDATVKGPGESHFALHVDNGLPSPLPPYAVGCSAIYVLTDYTKENGATAVVPGSHRECRQPTSYEAEFRDGPIQPVAVTCPAGSLICLHSNTWHGAYPRTTPGLRVNVILSIVRQAMRMTECLAGNISSRMLDRNPPRFAILTQNGTSFGFTSEEDYFTRAERAGRFSKAFPVGLNSTAHFG